MPNGPAHTTATFAAAAILTVAAAYSVVRYGHIESIAVPIGALAGTLLTPDLDGKTISHERARSINLVFGWLWEAYWYPYALVMPHRHKLSHAPILSTLIRLIYASLWAVPIVLYFRLDLPWSWIGAAAVGLCVVDVLHVGMDAL